MAVKSKRLRFEIFKRDGFRCAYCGATPQQLPLHCDHVIPESKGGTDDPANLVTACRDCNGGKSNIPLEERRLRHVDLDPEAAREHAEQIREYLEAQKDISSAQNEVLEHVREHWEDAVGWELLKNEERSILGFLQKLDIREVKNAIDVAASAKPAFTAYQAKTTFKYFCGICWRVIRGERGPGETVATPTTLRVVTSPVAKVVANNPELAEDEDEEEWWEDEVAVWGPSAAVVRQVDDLLVNNEATVVVDLRDPQCVLPERWPRKGHVRINPRPDITWWADKFGLRLLVTSEPEGGHRGALVSFPWRALVSIIHPPFQDEAEHHLITLSPRSPKGVLADEPFTPKPQGES